MLEQYIFTIPLFILSMGPMILYALGIHFEITKQNVLLQFFLTIAVMIVGGKIYKVGFQNLIQLTPNMDACQLKGKLEIK